MAYSVGEIGLDLVANSKGFERQMNGIAGKTTGVLNKAFKGLGITIAACFAVDKVVKFSKECLKLGSDLAEVQNVVDVTFGAMNKRVEDFAKNAAGNYGLSETMAKKYLGTFGAMSKAFGYSTDQAADMSMALTGLAGDVASFYNINQDEAYTKLKSVFSGETETLKDLGVVMTQNALDQYALAKGYGKTTAKMTEQEKVALRLAFVQEKLALASGDFARTQGSWANQTRLLTLQWQSFKATIGQGLINLLTPVLKIINNILAKLQVMANAFKNFTEMFMGNSQNSDDMGSVAGDIADVTTGMDGLQDSATGVGDAAEETAKKIKNSVMAFDELNLLNEPDEDTGNTDISIPTVDTGALDNALNQSMDAFFNRFKDEIKRLKDLFKTGWEIGLDGNNLDGIKKHIGSIKDTLIGIFTDPAVVNAAKGLIDSFVLNFGKIAGSMASIGISVAEAFIGGVDYFLTKDQGFIKSKLVSIFDVTADILKIVGDWFVAIADVFTVFKSQAAKEIVGSALSIGNTVLMTCVELFSKIGRDLLGAITKPFIENKDAIKEAVMNTIEPIAKVFKGLADVVQGFCMKIVKLYDEHFKPLLDGIGEGLSQIFGSILDVYNTYVAPVLDKLADEFVGFFNESLKPMLEKLGDVLGKLGDLLLVLWKNIIVPLVDFLINVLGPVLGPIIEAIGQTAIDFITGICDILADLLGALGGIIDFLTGVFSGNWELAWQGIKDFLTGIFEAIDTLLGGFLTFLYGDFSNDISQSLDGIKNFFSGWGDNINLIIEGVKGLFGAFGMFMQGDFKGAFNSALEGCRNIFQAIFNSLPPFAQNAITTVKNWVEGIISKISFDSILQSFQNAFNGIYSFGKGILDGIFSMITGIVDACSRAIEAIKSLFSAKNEYNKSSNTWSSYNSYTPPKASSALKNSVPRLASGGYVNASTPQLALIGDNKTQGEIVAPEGKMMEVFLQALKLFTNQNTGKSTQPTQQLPEKLHLTVQLGDYTFINTIIDMINNETRRQGQQLIITTP